ncbi:FadR/GntR family transcriptional regulator [Streptomyces sp. NPDC050560]|uniref:FadR/GntR family transcriptional regulator n=1 Tax=Streptomyces sp. NPDC050560 TaxID=3365630 RepID=UPI0037BA6465
MSLTDQAILRIREMIGSGRLPPGAKLPPEQQLATALGLSRNLTREAVRALVAVRVLEIRRGDGTYVTSLEPAVLLDGIADAVELLRGDTVLELLEVRRLFEPPATALAATRITAAQLADVAGHLAAMRAHIDDPEQLNRHDADFHSAIVAATGNATLTTLLDGIAGRTLGARIWRGLVDTRASHHTVEEHQLIHDALTAHNPALAHAASLVHVSTTEQWLRTHLDPAAAPGARPPATRTDLQDSP